MGAVVLNMFPLHVQGRLNEHTYSIMSLLTITICANATTNKATGY